LIPARSILFAFLLLTTPVLAQGLQPGTDQYWQQVCAMKETQSNQVLVNLLKQLDDKQKEIDELKKQLAMSKSNG